MPFLLLLPSHYSDFVHPLWQTEIVLYRNTNQSDASSDSFNKLYLYFSLRSVSSSTDPAHMNPSFVWTQVHAVGAKLWWQFTSFFCYCQSFGARHSILNIAQLLSCSLRLQSFFPPSSLPFKSLQSYFLSVKIRPFLPSLENLWLSYGLQDKAQMS